MNRVGKSSDIAHLGVDTMGVFFFGAWIIHVLVNPLQMGVVYIQYAFAAGVRHPSSNNDHQEYCITFSVGDL